MKKKVVPCSDIVLIQTQGRDSAIQRVGDIFGYKLHLISSTIGFVIVPLVADFTTVPT